MDEDSKRPAPSEEAARRYPHTNGYNYEINPEGEPCICNGCHGRCAGECGCQACRHQFIVFCDVAGFTGQEDVDIERAAHQYRTGKT